MKTEIWRSHPDIAGIEVSNLGRVRTLDRVVSSEKMTRFLKGRVLKPRDNGHGYMLVTISIAGKWATKSIHRLVAQTFISNPDSLPEVNHKNCDRSDNRVSNLEFCTHEYNMAYKEKYGKAKSKPVLALNLATLEVSQFKSRAEAGRVLGADQSAITNVINGKLKQTHGYWFKADDGNGIEADKDKLKSIVDSIRFTRCVFAVNLITSEVSRFSSQGEASRSLGIDNGNINKVIKGRYKQTHGYWFTNADGNADDAIKRKLHDIKKNYS